jgi:hypothetical protein
LRTGDCGGFVKEDDNAVRDVPRDFFGDKGAPRSEIMFVGLGSSLVVVTSFWLLLHCWAAALLGCEKEDVFTYLFVYYQDESSRGRRVLAGPTARKTRNA